MWSGGLRWTGCFRTETAWCFLSRNGMRSHRNDIFLVAVLLLLGGVLALFLRLTRQTGGTVSVQMDGQVLMELPLDRDAELVLGEGAHTNTLVIEGGKARIAGATCPDRICVRQGAVQYAGESIVCLPHKLVITVQGGTDNGVDGSTG